MITNNINKYRRPPDINNKIYINNDLIGTLVIHAPYIYPLIFTESSKILESKNTEIMIVENITESIIDKKEIDIDHLQHIYHNIKVISEINKYDKLIVDKDKLYKDDRYLRWLRRKYTGDNRISTLNIIEKNILDLKNNYDNLKKLVNIENISILILKTIEGLNNLKYTYNTEETNKQIENYINILIDIKI